MKLSQPESQRLHFGSLQRDAALEFRIDVIIVQCPAIVDARAQILRVLAGHTAIIRKPRRRGKLQGGTAHHAPQTMGDNGGQCPPYWYDRSYLVCYCGAGFQPAPLQAESL